MRLHRSLAVRTLLAVVAIGTVLSAAAFVIPALRPNLRAQLFAAQSRWATNHFPSYRIVIEDDSGRCRQEAIVEGDRVVKTARNTCRIAPRSVASLFRLIEGTPPSRYQCVQHRCACDTVMSVGTRYDPLMGYPQRIEFLWTVKPNWRHRDFWSYLMTNGALPACRDTSFSRTINIIALEPFP